MNDVERRAEVESRRADFPRQELGGLFRGFFRSEVNTVVLVDQPVDEILIALLYFSHFTQELLVQGINAECTDWHKAVTRDHRSTISDGEDQNWRM
ncbi:hypothetical protein D3C80_1370740 [compost metagenome]